MGFGDRNLARHLLQQEVAEVLRRAVASFGSHRGFLAILGVVDKPNVIAVISLNPFLRRADSISLFDLTANRHLVHGGEEAGFQLDRLWG